MEVLSKAYIVRENQPTRPRIRLGNRINPQFAALQQGTTLA
jgi:hypothetical protein